MLEESLCGMTTWEPSPEFTELSFLGGKRKSLGLAHSAVVERRNLAERPPGGKQILRNKNPIGRKVTPTSLRKNIGGGGRGSGGKIPRAVGRGRPLFGH